MDRRHFLAATGIGLAASGGIGTAGTADEAGARRGPIDRIDAKAFHAMRRFAATPFGRIAYVERGRGPAALFIHGLPLNGFQWRGALERLSRYRRCIAPDSMGLGYTEVSDAQDLSPASQVAMLAAFLDVLHVDRVDLVASDSGGAIAQLFVVTHPSRVRTLLLTNCDVHEDSPPPALVPVITASRAGTSVDDVLVPQLRDPSSSRLATGLGGCCYSTPTGLTEEALRVYLEPVARTASRKAQFHRYCVALDHNPLVPIEPILRESRVPVRTVWGTADTIFDPSGPVWIDRIFPQSRGTRLVKGGNLFFPEEFPDVIAEEARRLWGV